MAQRLNAAPVSHQQQLEISGDIQRYCRVVTRYRDPPGQQSVYINPGNQEEERYRMTTFARFPRDAPVKPGELAKNGFVWTGFKDRVKCFNCGIQIDQWKANNNFSYQKRKYHYHQCEFHTEIPERNIPMDNVFHRQSNSMPARRQTPTPPLHRRIPSAGEVLTSLPVERRHRRNNQTNGHVTSVSTENMSPEQRQRLFPCLHPVNPHMRSVESRIATYDAGWQRTLVRSSPTELSESGLYFLGSRDRLKCWYCNGGLQNWEYEDDPWFEHAKWFPECEYLLREKGADYVHQVVRQFPNLRRPLIRNPSRSQVTSGLNSPQQRRQQSEPSEPVVEIVDPKEEVKKLKRKVNQEMESNQELVENAEIMGFNRKQIRAAFERKLSSSNKSYSRLGDLIESMVDFEGEIDSEDEEESCEQGSSSTERPSSPKDELKKLEEQKICKICRKENVEVLFLPCGHLVSCNQCSSTASQCPVCKMTVTDKIRIYAV